MKHIDINFRLSAMAAALMLAFGAAQADEIAQLTQPDSSLSFGIGNWTE